MQKTLNEIGLIEQKSVEELLNVILLETDQAIEEYDESNSAALIKKIILINKLASKALNKWELNEFTNAGKEQSEEFFKTAYENLRDL